MKLLIVFLSCALLISGSAAHERRFLDSVKNFFQHAANTVKNGVVDAAHKVEHGVVDAAHTVQHGVVDAAHTVENGIVDAAHKVGDAAGIALHAVQGEASKVGDAFSVAAGDIARYTSQATAILGPILDQVKSTVEPVAKQVLTAAVNQLAQHAPEILEKLGEVGLQQLATTILTSAVGKRDLSTLTPMEALRESFSHLVQEGVNKTVDDVHMAVNALDKFNVELQKEVAQLESSLKSSGADVQQVAQTFFNNLLSHLAPIVQHNQLKVDLSELDKVLPTAIDTLEQKLKAALAHSHKRGVILNLGQDVLGLIQQGEQHVTGLVSTLKQLAGGLINPTIDNVKHIAQTLLTNSGSMTAGLMQKAMTLLAPFAQQLGPLFSQLQGLASQLGLPTVDSLPLIG